MEITLENKNPASHRIVKTTPDELRRLANLIEKEATKVSLPGETVIIPMTEKIMLTYEPEPGAMSRYLTDNN